MVETAPLFAADSTAPNTSLDPLETTVAPKACFDSCCDTDPLSGLCHTFRHSSWRRRRELIFQAMLRAGLPLSRLGRFSHCGVDYRVLRHRRDPERFKVVTDHCHDRFCTPCAAERQATIRANLRTRLLDQPHRFLTLTIRNAGEPLTVLINRLLTAFRRLRQRGIWRERVVGGCSFLEVTFNPDRASWNPHLHCMLEGRYIPRPALSAIWLEITGDSTNVNLQLIRTKRAVVDYITKYATKPLPAAIFRWPDVLREAIQALTRRRLVLAFGRWRNWHLLQPPDAKDWTEFDSVPALRMRAADGDELASRIVAMISTADIRTGEFFVDCDLPPPDQ